MEFLFKIPYHLDHGEQMAIVGSLPQLGQGDTRGGWRLTYLAAQGMWSGRLDLGPDDGHPFSYRYAIVRADGPDPIQMEENDRFVRAADFSGCRTVEVRDFWKSPGDILDIFTAAPFRNVIFRRDGSFPGIPLLGEREAAGGSPEGNGLFIRLQVAAPQVFPGQRLFLGGQPFALGAWNPQQAVPMRPAQYPYWEADVILDPRPMPFSYKYGIGDAAGGELAWETGEDRIFLPPEGEAAGQKRAVIVADWPFRHPRGPWKGAGIAVPLFSVRTEHGMGVGEFPDLRSLADWAKMMGLRLIQLLPVNDTAAHGTWYDSYPYSVISVFALHPLYLGLSELAAPHAALAEETARQTRILNESPVLDYENVMAVKMDILRRLFTADRPQFEADADFQRFFHEHSPWLRPYAAFSFLRDRHGTSDYGRWKEDRRGSPETIARLTDPQASHYPDIAFHYYVQYHLHRQLMAAAAYVRAQGIVMKGDIPIGVARNSVETWQHPEWFHLEACAGAPPDDFSAVGQNWGFPTYDWESMAQNDYNWWRARLAHLRLFFDAVRVDHIIGFFRIWSIPGHALTALQGRFSPALPLTRQELEAAGLADIDALCLPRITDDVLEEIFGDDAGQVARDYLDKTGPGRYAFKDLFRTQRQIADHAGGGQGAKLLEGLLRLHDDVVFIPDAPDDRMRFHPRILMEKTFSFRALDKEKRSTLRRLYEDYFYSRQEDLWQAEGRKKLSALKAATDMLLCGEDLGMVPGCVPPVLAELKILALRIQRMPVAMGELFSDPDRYPYLSVASPGSHDMSSLRGWWEETDRAVIQMYYEHILGRHGIAPRTCEPALCREIIRLHLQSGSMWTIIPVQDLLGQCGALRRDDPHTERINDPATPHHNWNYRLHRTLEELLCQKDFLVEVRAMVHAARNDRIY